MKPLEFKKFVQIAKQMGLKRVKIGEISFEFENFEAKDSVAGAKKREIFSRGVEKLEGLVVEEGERMPSDDEMLLWSATHHFDQLRAERDEAKLPPKMTS